MILKLKNNKKFLLWFCITIVAVIITGVIMVEFVFATNETVALRNDENQEQFLFWEINHRKSNANLKYYGYGYTIALKDEETNEFIDLNFNGQCGKQVFVPNEYFHPAIMGDEENFTEEVMYYIHDLYNMLDVPYGIYYKKGIRIYLNGRVGMKNKGVLEHLYDTYDGVIQGKMPDGLETGVVTVKNAHGKSLTASVNGDGCGIVNAINHYHGCSWTKTTQKNLNGSFGITYPLKPAARFDGLIIEYFDADNNSLEFEVKNYTQPTTEVVTPKEFKGLEYARYELVNMVSEEEFNSGTNQPINVQIKAKSRTYNPVCYKLNIHYKEKEVIKTYDKYLIEYKDIDTNNTIDTTDYYYSDKAQIINFNMKSPDGYIPVDWRVDYYNQFEEIEEDELHTSNPSNTDEYINKNPVTLNITKCSKCQQDNYYKVVIRCKEKQEGPPVKNECNPIVKGLDIEKEITMKKSQFDKLETIDAGSITLNIKLDECEFGKNKDDEKVIGEHGFDYYDVYAYSNEDRSEYVATYDNKGATSLYIKIPKSKFHKSSDNEYTARIDTIYAVFCKCNGVGFYDGEIVVKVNITQNNLPIAKIRNTTKVELQNKKIRNIKDVAYINTMTTIENLANDKDGIDDIKYIEYTFKDTTTNEEYKIKTTNDGDGSFELESQNLDNSDKLQFHHTVSNGDIYLRFLTDTTWEITQYVVDNSDNDIENSLGDIKKTKYTIIITPKILDLTPTAVLEDVVKYRFPEPTNKFQGKQNRVFALNTYSSSVADYLKWTGVEIDHSKDSIEIVPLNNQSLDSIKLDKCSNIEKSDDRLKVYNFDITKDKLLFKEKGKYIIKLKVEDTDGNISDWTIKTITIVEDKEPTATATILDKFYRQKENDKKATIELKDIIGISQDKDIVKITKVQYKYDSDNDGNFDDEKLRKITLKNNKVVLETKELGKYRFYIYIKEEFGQPTIKKYITQKDYKTNCTYYTTEVDNVAPYITHFKITPAE